MKKIIVLLMTIIMVTGCGGVKKDNSKNAIKEVKVNKNKEALKDQEKDGLTFTQTSLTSVNKQWTLITTVTNNTGSDYELNEFKIILKDSEGNVIKTLIGYVGSVIPNNAQREINTGTYVDLSKVASIEYEVVK